MTGRVVWRALGAGLIIAGVVAIAALLRGDFGDTDARIIGTSVGFSIFAALGGSGDALRRRTEGGLAAVGLATLAVSGIAFLLLLLAIWSDDGDGPWQAWGVATLLALCGSHASLVLAVRRPGDTPTLHTLVAVSIVAAVICTLAGTAAIVELFDDPDEAFARVVGVVLVVMLLATGLQPILRRLASIPAQAADSPPDRPITLRRLADEVEAAADRIERLDSGEAAALRDLAGRARR